MPPVPQKTILKVRTFADDVKRAGGESAAAPAPSARAASTTIQHDIARELQQVPATPSNTVLPKSRTLADATKNLDSTPSKPISSIAANDAAFDIRSEAQSGDAEATIIRDHRAKGSGMWSDITRGFSLWFQELASSASQTFAHTPQVMTMSADIAPLAPSPEPAPTERVSEVPNPNITVPASVLPPAVSPAATPLSTAPTNSWRRISEPRLNTPLAHTTEEEALAYRQELAASISAKSAPRERETTFKTARPVRTPDRDERMARERLAALAQKVAEKNAETASPDAGERRMRDIPFVPPTYAQPEASQLRTYRVDALTDVKERNLSASGIASAEMKRRASGGASIMLKRPASRIFPIAVALAIVCVVGGGGVFAYLKFGNSVTSESAAASGFFKADITESIPLSTDRTQLLDTLGSRALNITLAEGEFSQWRLTAPEAGAEREVRTSEFMDVLDPRAPGSFLRSLDERMMTGSAGNARAPYLIIKSNSFEEGFAGMLAWEEGMSADLAPLYGTPVRRSYDPNSLTLEQSRPARFVDEVIQNNDVRVLIDETGIERIIYGFSDKNTIVITTNPSAFEALVRKLR